MRCGATGTGDVSVSATGGHLPALELTQEALVAHVDSNVLSGSVPQPPLVEALIREQLLIERAAVRVAFPSERGTASQHQPSLDLLSKSADYRMGL